MADSWGKLPGGLLQGRFTWLGDMNECEKVKGDRLYVNESSGEVTVTEKDGIKGAWGMAVMELPLPPGMGGPAVLTVSV